MNALVLKIPSILIFNFLIVLNLIVFSTDIHYSIDF